MAPKKKHAHKNNYYNDIALKLASEVFGVEHLHYGYFKGIQANIENLPRAQDAYLKNLLSFIPRKGVKRIFDVGCGAGGAAAALVKRGYQLVCLAPDPYLIEKTRQRTANKVQTITDLYENVEDEVPGASMDLILMSESCQYVNVDAGFANHRRFLRPGGYLLVADFFRTRPADERNPSKSGHMLGPFLEAAQRSGFQLLRQQDITEAVAPTMDLYQSFITNRIFPVVEALLELLRRALPRTFAVFRFFLGKRASALQSKYQKQGAALFKEYKRYMVFLFQLSANS
ncbi:MAG: class I SAM-dependent methyltransferase [Leptospirales bacterium]|nr:class I SAM-dependent methyltransferase [Leptospirales bacterium]